MKLLELIEKIGGISWFKMLRKVFIVGNLYK